VRAIAPEAAQPDDASPPTGWSAVSSSTRQAGSELPAMAAGW